MKRTGKFFLFLAGIVFFVFFPYSVSALSYWMVGDTLGLGTADLQETMVRIIQWILGLLGIIGVIMILYGGFTWLTSAGNEDKIAKAKKVITAAVVGLVIVLLAWAITQYVINTLLNVSHLS